MKTAIYARVSTNNGQDPEMQLREVRDYCQRRCQGGCERDHFAGHVSPPLLVERRADEELEELSVLRPDLAAVAFGDLVVAGTKT